MQLHELLRARAEQNPRATFARLGDDELDHGSAAERATRVAAALRTAGIAPGDPVGLFMNRSLELLPALLGILQAGAVCVPVDPEDPAERRQVILEHSGARILVTEPALAGDVPIASIDAVAAQQEHPVGDDHNEPDQLDDASLAFVFYTSGSTGRPKGVALSHRALLSGQQWLQRRFPLGSEDRHLLRTTLSVTNLIREVFWPLLAGGTIVVVPPGGHRDPSVLVDLVNAHEVATLLVVPALLASMIETPAFARNRSLKYVFSSSDVMPGDLPGRYFRIGVPGRLYNLYGLTEALYASCWECRPDDRYEGFVPVGYPAELTPVILDPGQNPVTGDQVGELYLQGVGIADGYFREPELTAERFVAAAGARTYRTGDLARRPADGRLELLGRQDNRVKISGHRVELGEVESALRQLGGVHEAVVVGRRGAGGHQRLIAYLTVRPGAASRAADLRAGLSNTLSEYMIPAAFVLIDEFPLTHNGKVDRRALEHLRGVQLELGEEFVAPTTELERFLCGIWSEVLGLERVGVRDNFFALGGDSIQGFLISARARQVGLPLEATQVFQTPTIAETALLLGDLAPATDGPHAEPSASDSGYALTHMQEGMLFHSLLDPGSGVYFEQFLYAIDGDLNRDRYVTAWREIVARHEILRVAVTIDALRRPRQVVHEQPELEITVLDWTDRDAAAQSAELEGYLRADRERGFDLAAPPLFRVTLIQTGPAGFQLLLSYHHLILDAWSLFVLLRDFLELYAAHGSGEPPRLAPSPSFGEYVRWLEATDSEPSRAYWQERLRGLRSPTVIGRAEKLGLSTSSLEMQALVDELLAVLTPLLRRPRSGGRHTPLSPTNVNAAKPLAPRLHAKQRRDRSRRSGAHRFDDVVALDAGPEG